MDRVREIDRSNMRSRSRSVDVTSLPISEFDATVDTTSTQQEGTRERDRNRTIDGEIQIEEVNENERDIGIVDEEYEEASLEQRVKRNINDIVDTGLVRQTVIKGELNNEKEKTTIGQSWADWFQLSVQLENTGSVARDHMANERTLLSWIRTAVSFVTFGIMFLQFFRLEEKSNFKVAKDGIEYDIADKKTRTIHGMSRPLGGMCILLGLLTVLFGSYRYFEVQSLLMRSYYPATRLSIAVLILINVALFVLLFVIDIKISI